MISFIKKIIGSKKKTLVVFLVILCINLALYLFLFQRANQITPPGHVHAMQNADTYYLTVIRQSKLGAWNFTYPYTTLPTPKIYTFLFFVGAGKIAALFHIDPAAMYELTRVTGGMAILGATYWLIALLFPVSLQLPAIIFTTVFDTGPLWTDIIRKPVWQWTAAHPELMLLTRRFWLPHHLWGEAFGLILLGVIIRTIQKPSWFAPILIVALSVAGPLINPTYYVILVLCVFAPWLVYAAFTKTLRRTFLPIFLATAGIGLAAVFTNAQFSAGPPWNNFLASEKSWWTTDFIIKPFVQSFSLYYPFVAVLLILVPFSWKKWSREMRKIFILAICWSALPAGLIYLSALPWIPLVNGRIGMDLSQVPIGILATLVFYAVGQMSFFRRPLKIFVIGLFTLVLAISITLSIVYFKQMIQSQNDDVDNRGNSWTIYPTFNVWNGMMALKNVPLWSHVMINPRVGDVLPAFVSVRVYQGNPYGDADWIYRRGLSYEFYRGDMSRVRLRWLLTVNDISYVFYGPEEKTSLITPTFYPDILTPVYTNPEVTIYKVRTSAL